jgi:hypothetical protein
VGKERILIRIDRHPKGSLVANFDTCCRSYFSEHLGASSGLRKAAHRLSGTSAFGRASFTLSAAEKQWAWWPGALPVTDVDPPVTAAFEASHERSVDVDFALADGNVPVIDETIELLPEKVVHDR